MELFSLVYVSFANDAFSDQQLLELLQVSQRNNARDGITGMLLYKQRCFMQLLEGPQPAVSATYDRLARDARHRDVTIFLRGVAAERDFTEWTMAFQDLDDEAARATPGFSSFLETDLSALQFASDPSRAHQLLRIFRRM